jgi:hypothetical protein
MSSCSTGLGTTQNPVFSGTVLINTTAPEGSGVANPPVFIWQSTGLSYEVVGVFVNPISVQGKQIQNINDCIAIWDTGMAGSDGNVSFTLFKQVVNGNLTSSSASLSSGHTYYWAVWAYDSQLDLTNSSAQVTFVAP